MNSSTVQQSFMTLQEHLEVHGLVFCPMCDDMHENNTFCQMPMEGGWL